MGRPRQSYCRTQVMPPFDSYLGVFCDVSSPTGGTLVHELVSDSQPLDATGRQAFIDSLREADASRDVDALVHLAWAPADRSN